jgi:hypothetical protein
MSDLMERLRAPFPPDRVSWRVGSTTQDKSKGMALAYIDARDVMDRLDDVCGPENWQCDYPHANGKTVCRIGIRIEGNDWVWKADGAGDTDYEAEKGALSDAFKRAAVRWGIGRYLYDVDAPWVAVEQRGKTYIIKDSEKARLAKMLGGAKPSPAGQQPPAQEPPPPFTKDESATVRDSMILALEKCDSHAEIFTWREQNKPTFARLTREDKLVVSKAKEIRAGEIDGPQKEAAE